MVREVNRREEKRSELKRREEKRREDVQLYNIVCDNDVPSVRFLVIKSIIDNFEHKGNYLVLSQFEINENPDEKLDRFCARLHQYVCVKHFD